MGWDGSGNFNRTNGVFTGTQLWQDSRDAARRIRADDHDTHDQDIADGLENTVTRDGQNSPSSNLPMGNFRHTSVGNAVNRNEYLTAGQQQDSDVTFVPAASVGGTADAITLAPSPAISAYAAGQRFQFIVESQNTGAVTVNVSGLGTQAVTKLGTTALAAGDLDTGQIADIMYDGTRFILIALIGTQAALGVTLGVPTLSGTNAFTGNNTFGGTTVFQSDDAGSAAAPIVDADRDSASPADNDFIGIWGHTGRNDAVTPETIRYSSFAGQILDFTDGDEDGRGILRAFIAGTDTDVITYGPGVQIGSPTGGDQGAGTLNATSVHKNGNEYSRPWTTPASINVNSGSSVSLLTGLDGEDVQEIEINLLDVSPSTQAIMQFQIGPTAGVETTGYSGKGGSTSSSTTSVANGSAFNVTSNNVNFDNADVYVGEIRLRKYAGNVWSLIAYGSATSGAVLFGFGRKTIAGELDQLDILLSTGNFDGSGTAFVRWR